MSKRPVQPPKREEVLTTHTYDGIAEYDNPMPGWWLWSFAACIVWAAVYAVGMSFSILPDYQADLEREMREHEALVAKSAVVDLAVTPQLLAQAAADGDRVSAGAGVFSMNCAACHGQKGEGLIGPNLTDTAWLYGPELTDIHEIVASGTPKGMPGWSQILTPDDLVAVIAFVKSLEGTDPPNAKEPQGTEYAAIGEESEAPSKAQ